MNHYKWDIHELSSIQNNLEKKSQKYSVLPYQPEFLRVLSLACSIVSVFFFCFLDAQPTDAERETWKQVDVVLKDARAVLDELQAYNGAGKEIREVHTDPLLLIQMMHFLINEPGWKKLEM